MGSVVPGAWRAQSAELGAELVGDPGQQFGRAVEGEGEGFGRVHRLRHEPILRAGGCGGVAPR
ncbi:hypothetical protein Slala03_11230 [Streptomyces lavendulae subsp. lavendulae]|nr:hypothetical protein Slala03_11230 [Streptomyces lavendulae subsp. lavendulae]